MAGPSAGGCRAAALRARQELARQAEAARLRRQRDFSTLIQRVAALAEVEESEPRRVVQRTEGGWAASTLNQYVEHGDETTYRLKLRVSKKTFDGEPSASFRERSQARFNSRMPELN